MLEHPTHETSFYFIMLLFLSSLFYLLDLYTQNDFTFREYLYALCLLVHVWASFALSI